MTIETEYGIAHVLSPAVTRDGTPGYYVIIRKRECHTWPFLGTYAYIVVPAPLVVQA